MLPEYVEKLRQEYTGEEVLVDTERPEMAQLVGRRGRVKTITMGGRALVQFEGADLSWHDIELDYLKVLDDASTSDEADVSEPLDVQTPAEDERKAADEVEPAEQLSRLEIARLKMESESSNPSEP